MRATRKNPDFILNSGRTIELKYDPRDQNQTKRPSVESVITSPTRRPPFENTSCECGDTKIEPTRAIWPKKYTTNTRMKICQCLARRKKLVIPFKSTPEVGFKATGRKAITTGGEIFSDRWSTPGRVTRHVIA